MVIGDRNGTANYLVFVDFRKTVLVNRCKRAVTFGATFAAFQSQSNFPQLKITAVCVQFVLRKLRLVQGNGIHVCLKAAANLYVCVGLVGVVERNRYVFHAARKSQPRGKFVPRGKKHGF